MIPSFDSFHVAYENGNIPVLKDAAIYGSNASGKSNLIKAMNFVQDFVLNNSELQDHRNDAYKFDKDSIKSPSAFVIEIIINNKLYQYGFAVSFMSSSVVKEWLNYFDQTSGHWINVFTSENDSLKLFEGIDEANKERVQIYNEDNEKRRSLLLLTVLSDKALKDDLLKESVHDVYNWIKSLIILFPNSTYNLVGAVAHNIDAVNKLYKKYFKIFGIDIDKIELTNVAIESLHIPSDMVTDMKRSLKDDKEGLAMLHTPKDDYLVSLNKLGELKASKVGFLHKNDKLGTLLSKSEESDGTNRLMDLIPLLGMIITNKRVAIIDEINRSLHSALTHQFIKIFFQQTTDNNGSQLIFTTHDILLLDSGMFGKKEIWFLDKKNGVSTLYPLDKFKLPSDFKDIGMNYMLGRFDAVPNF